MFHFLSWLLYQNFTPTLYISWKPNALVTFRATFDHNRTIFGSSMAVWFTIAPFYTISQTIERSINCTSSVDNNQRDVVLFKLLVYTCVLYYFLVSRKCHIWHLSTNDNKIICISCPLSTIISYKRQVCMKKNPLLSTDNKKQTCL